MSNLNTIVQFLAGKGLPDYIVAGIVGNMSVETGGTFSPTAYNGGEHAIGLCQWEGGRRSALQQFAAAHGGSESDLQTQLEFLWHEMHTTEAGSFRNVLQGASNAQEAASLWDQYYERSSGEARQERIDRAVHYMQTGNLPSGSNTGGGGSFGSNALNNDLTKNDFQAVDGLGELLASVPALKNLVNTALDQGWSIAKFQNEVEDSRWWKRHSDTARQVLITQANDPATYRQNLGQAELQVRAASQELGMDLSHDQIQGIARASLLTGNLGNADWLKRQIGKSEDYTNIKTTDHLSGEMAANAQQLQQLAGAYGLRWSPVEIAHRAKMIAMGVTTLDTYRQQATAYAKSAFPSFAKQLDEGQTMMDIASPYIQSASQILEMDPAKFDLHNSLVRKGLQGTSAKPGEPPSSMPLWQFEQTVRSDPRWAYTHNAHSEMATMALQLGQAWGFDG